MAAKQIYSLEFQMARNHIFSSLFGIVIAIAGVFLHNAYRPIGFIVSAIALILGSYLIKEMYQSKISLIFFAAGWLFVVIRGATVGNRDELLVEGNSYGTSLLLGGFIWLLLSLIRFNKNK
jgi:hypothetical protein